MYIRGKLVQWREPERDTRRRRVEGGACRVEGGACTSESGLMVVGVKPDRRLNRIKYSDHDRSNFHSSCFRTISQRDSLRSDLTLNRYRNSRVKRNRSSARELVFERYKSVQKMCSKSCRVAKKRGHLVVRRWSLCCWIIVKIRISIKLKEK